MAHIAVMMDHFGDYYVVLMYDVHNYVRTYISEYFSHSVVIAVKSLYIVFLSFLPVGGLVEFVPWTRRKIRLYNRM